MNPQFINFSEKFILDCKKHEPWTPYTGLREYEVFLHKIGDLYIYENDRAYTIEQALGDLTLFVRGKGTYIHNTNKFAIKVLLRYCKEFFFKLYLKQVKILFYENKKEFLPIIKEKLLELNSIF